jgi:UDPglucose 6-dehydrogenase
VGILGLAYKPDTDVIEESQGLELAKRLQAAGVRVVVFDPAAMENARRELVPGTNFANSTADCARQADVLAITTPWPQFRNLSSWDLSSGRGRTVVLDCWRVLDPEAVRKVAEYLTLGFGAERMETAEETPLVQRAALK